LFDVEQLARRKRFVPEILLPVSVVCLIWYFFVRARVAKCFTRGSKRFLCSRINTRFAREYVMFAAGDSGSLATNAALTHVSRRKFGE
jgi:hypothetical protein